jgi:putative acetyltransferase
MNEGRQISIEDPRSPDVVALLETHLEFARAASPPEDVHALDVTGLLSPDVTFFTLRDDGTLLGVGALREIDPTHGEIKSMHTSEIARGNGVGRAMLDHLLDTARARGYERVSLETGTMEEFAAARALYTKAGFEVCPPFADYFDSPHSVCMTLELSAST